MQNLYADFGVSDALAAYAGRITADLADRFRAIDETAGLGAPTLVLVGENGYEKYRGVSDIKGWLMKRN